MQSVQKLKSEILKLFTFAVTGFVSAAVDCGVYYILLNFTNINFRLIQPISMSVGLCCSFLFNRTFIFKNYKKSLSYEVVKYLFVCVIIISFSPVIISFYHIWFGEYVVKIPATLTTGIINYFLNRFFVYSNAINKIFSKEEEDEIL